MPPHENIGHAGISRMANITKHDDEFPMLEGLGLYAAPTPGDGNCLFHSLSDQLYGHKDNHHELRLRVIDHMRRHASYFKPFIDVAPVRRAPRRRVAASSRADLETHSESEIDKAYEHRLQRMQNSGVFGDNLEIQAFAREFGLTVKIYQRKLCLAITADNQSGNAHKDGGKVVHIAYHHRWEHYSSIRNRTGPHTGPPCVVVRPASTIPIDPVMVEIVSATLPYDECPQRIRDTLDECGGDINAAVAILLQDQDEMESDETVDQSQDFGEAPEEQQSSSENLEIQPPTEVMGPSPLVEAHEAMLTAIHESSAVIAPEASERTEGPNILECTTEPEQGDASRIKRRKSPNGVPISTYVSSSDESSSIGSSGVSSGSSDSEGRRRKPAAKPKSPPKPRPGANLNSAAKSQSSPQPTRRSPRIQAKAELIAAALAAPPQDPPQEPTPRSRRKYVKKKLPATGCRKQKGGNNMNHVTNGFRELYV